VRLVATALAILLASSGCVDNGPRHPSPSTATAGPGGQTVSATDLIILGEGNDSEIRAAVRRYGGTVIRVVKQTNTYTARFPVRSFAELRGIRDRLRKDGLNAALSPTLDPGKDPS
jgi:hypothetical protein